MGAFGEVLKGLRKKAGISQNELSKHIGVSKSSVNMYERGEREPSFETLEAIADYFNVDMDYLLGRIPNKAPVHISVQIPVDMNKFSDAAKPIVGGFCDAISRLAPGKYEVLKEIEDLRKEMKRTFSEDDHKNFAILMQSVDEAITNAKKSIGGNSENLE